MTDLQLKHGPWAVPPNFSGQDHMVTCDASNRINEVRSSRDPEWLRAVLADDHTQKWVKRVAAARLRKLEKAAEDCRSPKAGADSHTEKVTEAMHALYECSQAVKKIRWEEVDFCTRSNAFALVDLIIRAFKYEH